MQNHTVQPAVQNNRTHALLLLPGLDGTGEGFRWLCSLLPARVHTRILSYPPDIPLDYDALASSLEHQFPTHGRMVLYGESFGGPLALRLAARWPERFRAVVLCSTFATTPRPLLLPLLYPLLPNILLHHPPRLLLRLLLTGTDAPPEYVEWMVDVLRSVRRDVLDSRIRSVLHVDVRRELVSCGLPLLYLRGTHDRLIDRARIREITALRPDTVYTELPGPHQLTERRPGEVAAALLPFLDALPA